MLSPGGVDKVFQIYIAIGQMLLVIRPRAFAQASMLLQLFIT